MKSIFENHINLTAKVLDLRLERQNVVVGNITNVNTPQYKARRLEFEDKLQQALAQDTAGQVTRTQSGHMPSTFNVDSFTGDGVKEFKPRYVYGEDSVDLEKEMATMAKNAMLYNALAEVINKNFTGIQKAIQEGSK